MDSNYGEAGFNDFTGQATLCWCCELLDDEEAQGVGAAVVLQWKRRIGGRAIFGADILCSSAALVDDDCLWRRLMTGAPEQVGRGRESRVTWMVSLSIGGGPSSCGQVRVGTFQIGWATLGPVVTYCVTH